MEEKKDAPMSEYDKRQVVLKRLWEDKVKEPEVKGNEVKALIVKPEFAHAIMAGTKPVEFRQGGTIDIPCRVAIAASKECNVLGMATIFEWIDINDDGLNAWFFDDIVKFDKPQPYKHKKGCVRWITLNVDTEAPGVEVETPEDIDGYEDYIHKFFPLLTINRSEDTDFTSDN